MKKLLTVISFILVASLLCGLTAFAGQTDTPAYAAKLRFGEDGKFKILQIADIQEMAILYPITRNFITDIVSTSQPDLIVLTGDNIAGGGSNTTIKPLDKVLVGISINNFMKILESFGIPVAAVFGNHDAENSLTKEEQLVIYSKYDCFIGYDEGPAVSGAGNYNVPIYSSADSSKMAYNLWMVDSGMYDEVNGGYDYVKQDQIDWYVNTSNELKAANGGVMVPSMMFQHIIVPEIYDALKEVPEGTAGAISRNGKYYVLNEANTVSGVMHESPCPSNTNSGQFDAVVNQGDVVAMFFGHDHVNTFRVNYRGVDLVASPGITFQSYGDANRGAREIILDESNLLEYTTNLIDYHDIYGDDTAANLRFTVYGNEFAVLDRVIAALKYVLLIAAGFMKILN
jgi:predicted phosphodiesterase